MSKKSAAADPAQVWEATVATKIIMRPATANDASSDLTLADGSDLAGEASFGPAKGAIDVQLGVQPIMAIRAPFGRFRPMGNRVGSYTFEATRRFSSFGAAGRYMLTHGMSIPQAGSIIFDYGDNEGFVALLGCVIRQVGLPRHIGVSVTTSYAISFSAAAEATDDQELEDLHNEFNDLESPGGEGGGLP